MTASIIGILRIALVNFLVICSAANSTVWKLNAITIPEVTDRLRGRGLSISSTVATSDCSAIRLAPYPAELQLFYEYSVEFKAGRAVSLRELERAISTHVAHQLDMCDNLGRPVYKVKTASQHGFSDKVCMPKLDSNNGCIVVRGKTAILLDDDSAFVRTVAYQAIENGLVDANSLLVGYTDAVVRTEFLSKGKALLLEAGQEGIEDAHEGDSSHMSPITATIAAAAASVSFVVASIVCYGFMRKDGRQHPEPSVRHKAYSRKSTTRTIVSDSLGLRPRRHFVRLEDLSGSHTSLVTATMTPSTVDYAYAYPEPEEYAVNEENYSPSVTWSVSDVTWSDSASVRSGISRTPSMLERIEEEEEDQDEHDCGNDLGPLERRHELCHGQGRPIQTAGDFDCKSQHQDQMLDVSDLDACFTIVPDDVQSHKLGSDCTLLEEERIDEKVQSVSDNAGKLEPSESKGLDDDVNTSGSDFSESSLLVHADEPTAERSKIFIENVQASENDANDDDKPCAIGVAGTNVEPRAPSSIVEVHPNEAKEITEGTCLDMSLSPLDPEKFEREHNADKDVAFSNQNNLSLQGQEDNAGTNQTQENSIFVESTLFETVSSVSHEEHQQQNSCPESLTNAEDSIDVWVEELLEQ